MNGCFPQFKGNGGAPNTRKNAGFKGWKPWSSSYDQESYDRQAQKKCRRTRQKAGVRRWAKSCEFWSKRIECNQEKRGKSLGDQMGMIATRSVTRRSQPACQWPESRKSSRFCKSHHDESQNGAQNQDSCLNLRCRVPKNFNFETRSDHLPCSPP